MVNIKDSGREGPHSASLSHCSVQQYNSSDPIQQHFHQASAAYTGSVCVCVCVFVSGHRMYICAHWLLCLCFSNYSPPLAERSQIPHSFSVLKVLFHPRFPRPFSICCTSGPRIASLTIICTFVTTHVTAGACLCAAARGLQFLYITLRIPALFDFGLHDLFAWARIFESKTEPGGNCASHFAGAGWGSAVVSDEWPTA